MALETIHIYSDESRHRTERNLLVAGLWIEEQMAVQLDSRIVSLRKERGYKDNSDIWIDFAGEFKWTKVHDKYLDVYKSLIDIVFEMLIAQQLRITCLVLDTTLPEVKMHNNIKGDGYFKLLYQLYYQNSHHPAKYKIFPDEISNQTKSFNLEVLQRSLNNQMMNKFLPKVDKDQFMEVVSCVRSINPIDSKTSNILQALDVIMGGVGYWRNEMHKRDNCRRAKNELMQYICVKLIQVGVIRVRTDKTYTIDRSDSFNIWFFKPKTKITL